MTSGSLGSSEMIRRRDASEPSLASVMIRSTWPRTSLARASVVLIGLVAQDGHDQALVERLARAGLAAELATVDAVWPGSGLLVVVVVVVERRPRRRRRSSPCRPRPAAGSRASGGAPSSRRATSCRSCACAAGPHPGGCQQLADLDDVVALQRVVGAHGQVEVLDGHVQHVLRAAPARRRRRRSHVRESCLPAEVNRLNCATRISAARARAPPPARSCRPSRSRWSACRSWSSGRRGCSRRGS